MDKQLFFLTRCPAHQDVSKWEYCKVLILLPRSIPSLRAGVLYFKPLFKQGKKTLVGSAFDCMPTCNGTTSTSTHSSLYMPLPINPLECLVPSTMNSGHGYWKKRWRNGWDPTKRYWIFRISIFVLLYRRHHAKTRQFFKKYLFFADDGMYS